MSRTLMKTVASETRVKRQDDALTRCRTGRARTIARKSAGGHYPPVKEVRQSR